MADYNKLLQIPRATKARLETIKLDLLPNTLVFATDTKELGVKLSNGNIEYFKNATDINMILDDAIELIDTKQDKLIAGNNITIENNVISASGGGNGGGGPTLLYSGGSSDWDFSQSDDDAFMGQFGMTYPALIQANDVFLFQISIGLNHGDAPGLTSVILTTWINDGMFLNSFNLGNTEGVLNNGTGFVSAAPGGSSNTDLAVILAGEPAVPLEDISLFNFSIYKL